MDTSYIYSGTRAKALENTLLTETQIERLLSAKEVAEVYKVLQDTYLAHYLDPQKKESAIKALDQSILEGKQTLESIAPVPELLKILWLKHDYHNLKTIVKGKRAGLSNEEIISYCFFGGVYLPEKLLKHYDEKKLQTLDHNFKAAVERAELAQHVFEIDIAMNTFYFKAIREIALINDPENQFVSNFIRLQIDLFNIKAALRSQRIETLTIADFYVQGGTFQKKDLEHTKQILDYLPRYGGLKKWTPIIESFVKETDYVVLERTLDEYTARYVKEQALDLFSVAPLYNYFGMLKINAQTIGAIIVAKKAGMSEKELRTLLRRVYT